MAGSTQKAKDLLRKKRRNKKVRNLKSRLGETKDMKEYEYLVAMIQKRQHDFEDPKKKK